MKTILPFIALLIATVSCTKELKYTKEDLLKILMKVDPTIKIILPKSINDGVTCAEYNQEGCLSAHIVQIKNLEMIGVEFTTEAQAIMAAKKYRGYYTRNWLLDDVTGEPDLEKFVTEHLQGKKP